MNQPGNPPKPNACPWGSSFDPSRPPPPDFTTAMRRAELDAIRKKDMDLQAGDEGELASERSAALPLLVNQGFDPRFQRPSRRQVTQSTRRRSTKPYVVDYRDSNGLYQ